MNGLVAAALAVFFTGVQLYTSLAALSPTPPVGFTFLGRAGAGVLAGVLALAAAVALAALRRAGAPDPALRRMLVIWFGAALVSSLLGLDPLSGLQVCGVILLTSTFALALERCYAVPPVARAVLGVYLGFGLIAALAALGMLVTKHPLVLYELNHGRAAGFFVTANQCAAYLLLCGFVALGTAAAARGPLRLLATLTAIAAGVALLATFSRSGWLGALGGGIFLALAYRRRLAALLLGVIALAGVALALALPVARHDPADTFSRVAVLDAGIRAIELFPLTGTGPMAYWRAYPALRLPEGAEPGTFGALHPHDVYVSLAGELGLAGTLAVLGGWAIFVRALLRRLRAPGGDPATRLTFAAAIAAALVAVLVQGIFDTIGIVQLTFVWIPYAALALAAARDGLGTAPGRRGAG